MVPHVRGPVADKRLWPFTGIILAVNEPPGRPMVSSTITVHTETLGAIESLVAHWNRLARTTAGVHAYSIISAW